MQTLSFISLLALVATAVAAKEDLQYTNYSFEAHLEAFGLKYHPSEMTARRAIFEKELQRVREHNAKNLSWSEGMNKFSTLTESERKKFFGRNKRVAKNHGNLLKNARPLPADFVMQPLEKLPKSVDWRKKGVVSAVKDQGYCGSCW